jgi:hypothetical protein
MKTFISIFSRRAVTAAGAASLVRSGENTRENNKVSRLLKMILFVIIGIPMIHRDAYAVQYTYIQSVQWCDCTHLCVTLRPGSYSGPPLFLFWTNIPGQPAQPDPIFGLGGPWYGLTDNAGFNLDAGILLVPCADGNTLCADMTLALLQDFPYGPPNGPIYVDVTDAGADFMHGGDWSNVFQVQPWPSPCSDSTNPCCSSSFNVSIPPPPPFSSGIVTLSYTVTGGVIDAITTSPCMASSPFPGNTPGNTGDNTSSGSLTFPGGGGCSPLNVQVVTTAKNATGLVCIDWTATTPGSQLGAGFTWDTTICIKCYPAPTDCSYLLVTPAPSSGWNRFGIPNVSKTFTFNNTKYPVSDIQSVVWSPALSGTSLLVDGIGGIIADPFSSISLDCDKGSAATSTAVFTLSAPGGFGGFGGTVDFTVTYCDGDTCDYSYVWPCEDCIIHQGGNGNGWTIVADTTGPVIYKFGLKITPPDSTASLGISVGDSTDIIMAITPPSSSPYVNGGNLFGTAVSVAGNTALYVPSCLGSSGRGIGSAAVTVSFKPGPQAKLDSIPVRVTFYNKNADLIGSDTLQLAVAFESPGVVGAMRYNTTTHMFEIYNGATKMWDAVTWK